MTREEIEDFAVGNGLTFEDAEAVLSTMGQFLDDEEKEVQAHQLEHKDDSNFFIWIAIIIIFLVLIVVVAI